MLLIGLGLLGLGSLTARADDHDDPIDRSRYSYEYRHISYYTPARIQRAIDKANGAPTRFFWDIVQDIRIENLANYPFIEVYDGMVDLIRRSVADYCKPHKDDEEDMRQIHRAMTVLGAITPRGKLAELTGFVNDQARILQKARPDTTRYDSLWRETRKKIRLRVGKLQSGKEAIASLERGEGIKAFPLLDSQKKPWDDDVDEANAFTMPEILPGSQRLKDFRKALETNVLEQTEVINSMVATEVGQAILGSKNRKTEIIAEVEGLPGNGKDTLAKEYTDALNGFKGAWVDNMYPIKITRKEEMWSLFGPASGFVNSDQISDFIKFLVRHSGGKYVLRSAGYNGGSRECVQLNPNWYGSDLPGHNPHAVVLINEWQNWSVNLNDEVLREMLETGVVPINNPNGCLGKIKVAIKFILASNYNIDMIANRKLDGSRSGPSRSYEELMRRWPGVQAAIDRRRQNILANASKAAPGSRSDDIKGVNEPTLNRIPKNRSFFLRPISPANIQVRVRMWLKEYADEISSSTTDYGKLRFQFSDYLVKYIQEYHYEAEENLRPILGYVDGLVKSVITNAMTGDGVNPPLLAAPTEVQNWMVDIEKIYDGTSQLILSLLDAKGVSTRILRIDIPMTVIDKTPEKLTAEDIAKILKLPEEISKFVIADPRMLDRAVDSTLRRANVARTPDNPQNPTRVAKVSLLLGPTSVGKTQWAKALASAATGRQDSLKILNFGNVLHKQDMTLKVWGVEGSREHERSEIAQHLDDHAGEPTFMLLDEMSNVQGTDPWFVVYDLIREAEPTQFADHRTRKMGQVDISMAANFTQEWYQNIPADLPNDLKIFAAQRIYQNALSDPNYVQRYLLTKLPQPLLARIGMDNVYLFSPLDFQQIRKIYQLKFQSAVQELEPQVGKIGYYLSVDSAEGFEQIMRQFENYSYIYEENGASINRSMSEGFQQPLETFLLRKGVPDGAKVTIVSRGVRLLGDPVNTNAQNMVFDLYVNENPQPLKFEVRAQDRRQDPLENEDQRILVAAHEAAHIIVGEALIGHLNKAAHVSIIPGVTNIADQWVVYEGIAGTTQIAKQPMTLDLVLSMMAHLHAGYLGQAMVAPKHAHDFGKSNDMQRATEMAQAAIVQGGLMPDRWGVESVPQGMKLQDFIRTLSPDRRLLLNELVKGLMDKAALRALAVLLREKEGSFANLTIELSQKGEMYAGDLNDFFKRHPVTRGLEKVDFDRAEPLSKQMTGDQSNTNVVSSHQAVEFDKWFPREKIKKVAIFQEFLEKMRREQTAQVAFPKDLRINPVPVKAENGGCEAALAKGA